VATGHLILKQNTSDGVTRTATARKLTYFTRDERLILEGDVNAVDSKGQKLKGPEATAIIREGAEEFRMQKGATAEILIEDEDEPATNTAPVLPTPVPPPVVPSAPRGTNPPTTPTTPEVSPGP
jgi:lipopolysaccharide export system protein LptA